MTTTLPHPPTGSGIRPRPPRLTLAETQALAELANGATLDLAARRLDISTRTLRRRVRSVCDRLDVNTPIEAIVWAAKHQLI